MLKEFAHCYSLKTRTSFDVKCHQIRYVQCSLAICAKYVCTDALRISSTWQLKQSYRHAASPSIILAILKKTQSLRMWMGAIRTRLASSELSALRYMSTHSEPVFLMCVDPACSSSQCKQLFKTIQECIKIRPCQLLLDMKVRWSSTYIMLTCAESRRQVSR